MKWRRKQHFVLCALPSPPLQTPFTLSKALCATAPITQLPCAMILWNIYNAGSFGKHSEPFHSHSLARREEIALRSPVLTRRSRVNESKRLISSRRASLWEQSIHIRRVHLRNSAYPKTGSQPYLKHLPARQAAYWHLNWWRDIVKRSWGNWSLRGARTPS